MKKLAEMKFGSTLYGTSTPSSDVDIKGIFLPSKEDILLGRVPKSITENTKKNCNEKNSCDDIDKEFYSLHYFLKLACEGETVALDMLHVNDECLISSSNVFESLRLNRHKFYTRNLKSFVGYCKRQCAKYSVKSSRLRTVEDVLKFLREHEHKKLFDVWSVLPHIDHTHFSYDEKANLNTYEICGKKFQETVRVDYIIPILERFYNEYGHRAILAKENKNIDWKAVSHALRAAYQTKAILTEGDIHFPLKEANYLKQVKNGELDFLTVVSPKLEELMDEIEELSNKSLLPEKVDRKFWDLWLMNVIEETYYGLGTKGGTFCNKSTRSST
jgi:predicted nucleotidyltransferase